MNHQKSVRIITKNCIDDK